ATSIRLFTIELGIGEDPLRCRLKHAVLISCEAYEAISYVWGEPVYSYSLICNDQILMITPSLRDVLLRVRRTHVSRTIWADGACINQEDLNERGHQVNLMSDVYRKETRVLIHLGPADENIVSKALELIHGINNKHEMPAPSSDDWIPLLEFGSCQWFRRLWVVQECVLAQEAIV
ncbi:hypothetical protein CC78DRAFT_447525, partial [Lojkania enalia]